MRTESPITVIGPSGPAGDEPRLGKRAALDRPASTSDPTTPVATPMTAGVRADHTAAAVARAARWTTAWASVGHP